MGRFLYEIIDALLALAEFAIVVSAIMSWLVAFDVINLRNRFVNQVARFLDAVTRPILRPLQRFIPALGGVDITPIIAIIIIQAIRSALLPWVFTPIIDALGG
ncbi:MAG TPA: YggT family protein [Phenylobacterium sp.]|jgi:YggT family protein|nr:YggT family protein [Phenylobacterium sp.]